MRCLQCGGKVAVRRENHRYGASGLRGITLVGVPVRRCVRCDEFEVVIPKIVELHRLIASALTRKKARLAPAEIRFLRQQLGWSGRDFAEHFGVAAGTVSRWENGPAKMSAQADRLLRLMVAHFQPTEAYSLDILKDLARGRATPLRLDVRVGRQGWSCAA